MNEYADPPNDDEINYSLRAAVTDLYDDEGQRVWWSAFSDADDERRRHMAAGVLYDHE